MGSEFDQGYPLSFRLSTSGLQLRIPPNQWSLTLGGSRGELRAISTQKGLLFLVVIIFCLELDNIFSFNYLIDKKEKLVFFDVIDCIV